MRDGLLNTAIPGGSGRFIARKWNMTLTITRHRRTAAAVATGALAASALLFAPAAQAETLTDVRESQIAPNEAVYAGWHQGAEGGKATVTSDGLTLDGRSQIIKGYTDNKNENLGTATRNFDITKLPGSSFTVKSGVASFQIPLFVDTDDNSATPGVFTTLRTPLIAGGTVAATDKWESSKAFGTIAANTPTDLSQIIGQVSPHAYKVIAFGVYNETGTSVVSDILFDGTRYTFKNNAPTTPTSQSVTSKINGTVTLPLSATDVDGNALTYTATSVVGGTVSGPGSSLTFTPAANFRGTAVVNYTVTDGRGGSANGSISIKVEKLKTKVDIYRVKPASGKISVRNTVSFYAAVTIDGQKAPKGTTIQGYAKSKLVVTGKVNSSGKVKLTLPGKLPYGKSTLKAVKVGSSTLDRAEDSVKVRVTRK